jgi:heme-degrading monooxygenase HmoA
VGSWTTLSDIDRKELSMIARLAEHSRLPADLDPDYVARHRAWIAAQPGFCGGYHLLEPETGRALSLTMWRDEDALAAVERAQSTTNGPADGRISRESRPTVRIVHVAAVF